MIARPKVREAVDWYSQNRPLYQALAKRAAVIVREVLQTNKLNYHSITYRAKTLESYREKANKEIYKDPHSEIRDMAGVRIITYTDSDAEKVSAIISKTFDIHSEDINDKARELGIDKMGYRSIHCMGTLGKERLNLPENRVFKDMAFEIQIRTILQHAWAEFEHDRNYKFSGVLPADIRRRLSVVAGNLELVDREFERISEAIDSYALNVREKTQLGELDIPINSTSLTAYMTKEFESLVRLGIEPNFSNTDAFLFKELSDFGIVTLKQLDDIIPRDYIEKKSKILPLQNHKGNLAGIIVDALIIHDVKSYFRIIRDGAILTMDKVELDLFKDYGVNFAEFVERIIIYP